jgi:hypothetical protein
MKPRRNQKSLLVSMVIKRSPKRLKYTADTTRFNKVGTHSLFLFFFFALLKVWIELNNIT